MKLFSSLTIIAVLMVPVHAEAAWWNPFSWKNQAKQATSSPAAATTTPPAIVESEPSADDDFPSKEELLRRIAELEEKLEDAYSKLSIKPLKDQFQAATKSEPKTEAKQDIVSDEQVISKAKPAIAYVETATSSGSAVIIDPQGHILVDAKTVWREANGKVVGAASEIAVTLSNGAKKSAKLVGLDEARNVAVIQIQEKGTYPYLKQSFESGVKLGDRAYVFGFPKMSENASNGYGFVAGSITKKSDYIELTIEKKPLDNGGALVNSKGEFIAIPSKATCKVLEDMKNCLKYTLTAESIKTVLPKLLDGMILYKDKSERTPHELLVKGKLQGMYIGAKESGVILQAVNGVTGKNNFDYYNTKLEDDENFKITRLYLNKLRLAAISMGDAYEFLKDQAYDLHIFLINESAANAELGNYQKKMLKQVDDFNEAKLKEYQEKLNFWSKKKNEYDGYLVKYADTTHDYLMEQGVFIETSAEKLLAEQKKVLDTYTSEVINIF